MCANNYCDLFFLVNGPNNNVWAMTRTYSGGATADNATPTGSAFFEFSSSGTLLKTFTTSDVAVRIAGTSRAVWFTDYAHDAVGKIDGSGIITEYPIPTQGGGPYGIAAASNGTIWFTEFNSHEVGRMRTNGNVREFAVPFAPFSIAATPSGCVEKAIWIGSLGSQIAKITL